MKTLIAFTILGMMAIPACAQYDDEDRHRCMFGRCGRGGAENGEYLGGGRSGKRDREESYRERRDRRIYNEQRGWRYDDPRGRRRYRDY